MQLKRNHLLILMLAFLFIINMLACGNDLSSGAGKTQDIERRTEQQIYDSSEYNNMDNSEEESELQQPAGYEEEPEGLPKPALDAWGVTLSVKDVTQEGLTIVCTQSGGTPTGELSTGTYYVLERKEADEWIPVADILEGKEVCWDEVAWIISMNDVTEWEVEWEWMYGKLTPGYYRIGKEIMDFRETGDYDKEMYYAEFEIEQ